MITLDTPFPDCFDTYDEYIEACATAGADPIDESDWYDAWFEGQRDADLERRGHIL